MQTQKLRYFCEILEHGSIRAAAESLGLTQPSLTQALKSLERELDVKLLNRSRSGISLTTAGEVVAARAREILGDMARMRREVDELRSFKRGEVSLGVAPVISAGVVGRFVTARKQAHPNVVVRLVRGGSEWLCDRVASGQLDLAICRMPQGQPTQLESRLLRTDPYVIWMRKQHPLAGSARPVVAELRDYPWVFARAWKRSFPEMVALFDALGSPSLEPSIDVSDVDMIATLLEQDDYLSMWPRSCFSDRLENGTFAELALPSITLSCEIAMVSRAGKALSPAATVTAEEMLSVFRNGAPLGERPASHAASSKSPTRR